MHGERCLVLPRQATWSGCARIVLAATVLSSALCGAAYPQSYPDRPIRVIIPFTAGSATDLVARRIAVKMSENWGQQVVIDNRGGGGGTIATSMVAKAAPDGYTLLTHSIAFAMNAALYSKLPYDPVRDFAPASQIAVSTSLLLVSPSLGAKSVKELIALAKQKPGQLNFGSSGVGSGTHLNAEQFRFTAGIDVVHVPYKGVPETLIDLMTGRIDFFLSPLVPALPLLKEGKLHPAGGDDAAPQRSAGGCSHDGGGGAAGLRVPGVVRRVRARPHAAADRRDYDNGLRARRRSALIGPAAAQDFPARPITLIVPFPAGGATDILARLLSEGMRPALGQQVARSERAGRGRDDRRRPRHPVAAGRIHL